MPRRLAGAVRQLAAQNGSTVSQVIQNLLTQVLEEGGAKRLERDLADEGYRVGVNQGRHEFYEHMKQFSRK